MVANGFEGVPWMVGGGAKHSANVGRVLAYAATGGGEGVVAPGDCKVSSSASADNKVHIATGAVAIRNRYGAAATSETYIGRAPQVSDVTVGSTGSSGRSDLIVARILDPQYGAQAPASIADGPYIVPDIIPGVPAGTTSAQQVSSLLNQPVYALARIDIPPNTTAITGGMIKELRELVQPRSQREMYSNNAAANPLILTATDYVDFGPTMQVKVPNWATHADARISISGILQLAAMADTLLIAQIGGAAPSGYLPLDNDGFSDGQRTGAMLTIGPVDVTSMRGQTITIRARGKKQNPARGSFKVDASTHFGYDVQFSERPL